MLSSEPGVLACSFLGICGATNSVFLGIAGAIISSAITLFFTGSEGLGSVFVSTLVLPSVLVLSSFEDSSFLSFALSSFSSALFFLYSLTFAANSLFKSAISIESYLEYKSSPFETSLSNCLILSL